MQTTPDEIAAFLAGDRTRVREIRAAVERVVRSFQFPDSELDRDLVQDTLSRVIRNLAAGQFRGESSLRTYAQRVARYTCIEHLRRRRLEVRMNLETIPSTTSWSEPEASFLRTEEHRRNVETFAALSGESRELLRLAFLEGLSYAEIARRVGVSEGAIKLRVRRIRLACRAALRAAVAPGVRRSKPRVRG